MPNEDRVDIVKQGNQLWVCGACRVLRALELSRLRVKTVEAECPICKTKTEHVRVCGTPSDIDGGTKVEYLE